MKNLKRKNTFNLAMRFVFAVFFITLISGMIAISIAMLLFRTGLISFNRASPLLMLSAFFLSSLIVGTILAITISNHSFKNLNKILNAVSEVGKGNFNIDLAEVKDGSGNINEIAKNITLMAKELNNLEIMRNDFINDFSHEFKTPIVSIQGFTKRLLTKDLTEEKKQEYLNIILEESTRLAQLSNNTLYISKLESIKRTLEMHDFMLDEQIRQCILLLEKKWTKKNIKIIPELSEIKYAGNEEMLKQVWLNLIDNAIKFTPDDGEVQILASATEKGVIISISDSGIGMSEEAMTRIFDKFYQSDPSRSTEGNGLGLSIVKKILDFHHGTITVNSTKNIGTVFTITL